MHHAGWAKELAGVAAGIGITVTLAACAGPARLDVAAGTGPEPRLPAPQAAPLPTVDVAAAVGWKSGESPIAPAGVQVRAFARDLDHPRWLYVLPNGDVLVAETAAPPQPADRQGLRNRIMALFMRRAGADVPSADRITLLRDRDGDCVADVRSKFIEHLSSPFGMALVGREFYVANTDGVVRFPYAPGATRVEAAGEPLVALPAGDRNHHWTKNLLASRDGRYLFATVGSNSNVAEHGMAIEQDRAAIWQIERSSGRARIFASGLRNPNGMAWVPETGQLWVAVNERDELGSDLVPDYMTAVKDGAFYGWPYSYFGGHVDRRVQPQQPDLVARAQVPDYALGPHTASLGLAYARMSSLPGLGPGMFVGQHGSWNRKPPSGYRVVFVPFRDGVPAGLPRDVLTGFRVDGVARGRPVGVAIGAHGDLLVADDVGNTVWCASGRVAAPAPAQ